MDKQRCHGYHILGGYHVLVLGSSITKCNKYFADFSPFKCNINPFFDIFVHKTFAHFILHTFWCILMHSEHLEQNILFLHGKSSILPIYIYVIKTTCLIILCTKHLHSSFCLHFDAFWCTLMHFDAFSCTLMHFDAFWWI